MLLLLFLRPAQRGKAVCVMCMLRGNSDRIIRDGYHPNAIKWLRRSIQSGSAIKVKFASVRSFKTGLKNFLISWAAFQIFPENLRLRSNAVLRRHELDLQQFESTLIVSSPVRSKPLLTRRNRTLKKKSQKLLLLNTAFDPVLKSLVRKFG